MKESHSSMKCRVFSTPRVSEPQCSNPKLVKFLRMSRRSLDEMSQCLFSFISVKIQGLMRAPLTKVPNKLLHNLKHTYFIFAALKAHPPCNHDARNSCFFSLDGIFIGKDVSIACVINTRHLELLSSHHFWHLYN